MAIASMTGYARVDGQSGPVSWTWEIKSVNGRGLDIRCRLPAGYDWLELPVREAMAARLKRGNVSATLSMSRTAESGGVQINEALVAQMVEVFRGWRAKYPELAPPSLDALLGVRGVMEQGEPEQTAEARAELEHSVLGGLDDGLAALNEMRLGEGRRLEPVLLEQLDRMEEFAAQAESSAALRPEAVKERLRAQIAALLDSSPSLPEERLAQEAALLATKMDVREEIDRLRAHLRAARDMIAAGGAVGRRLDFLCQEFNREANTICSKSGDVALTRAGLDLKAAIDQFREQVQNIE